MIYNSFKIVLLELHWISEENTETDLCAHGQVRVQIGDEIVVDQDDSGGWTVSAMALLLLRTLERDHTQECPVGDQLVPCCGHFMVFQDDMEEVYMANCQNGVDWEVRHENGVVKLKTKKGTQAFLAFEDYKKAVLVFVDQVRQFYQDSPEKILPSDEFDRVAYVRFWEEWHGQRSKWV
ncbi:MAG: hypothetical protein V4714_05240 [Bacteroidota bacterium]